MIVTMPQTGKPIKTYPDGRVCTSCSTVLSIYNARTRCGVCEPLPDSDFNIYEAQAVGEALRDLMEDI